MAFTEDLDVFLEDFGVEVSAGGETGLGILDMPDITIVDGVHLSTEYVLTFKSSDFPDLAFGDEMVVDSIDYTVKEVQKIDDGKFSRAYLNKV